MKLWEDSKRRSAQEIVSWLIERKTGGGWPVDWPTNIAFRELISSANYPDLQENLIMTILNEMINDDDPSIKNFETKFQLKQKEKAISSEQSKTSWSFFIPLRLTLDDDVKLPFRITILGRKYQLRNADDIRRGLNKEDKKRLDDGRHYPLLEGLEPAPLPDYFLTASDVAASWGDAWDKLIPSFDAFRGFVEIILGFREWRLISSRKGSRSKIPHPMWMAVKSEKNPLQTIRFAVDDDRTKIVFNLTSDHLSAIKKESSFLAGAQEQKSTSFLISDCLRLYTEAVDARFTKHSFLAFWQLAEAITRSETFGGSSKKVAARLAWHGNSEGFVGSGYSESLRVLSDKRNQLVHHGIDLIHNEDVNLIKLACEFALIWLIRERKEISTLLMLDKFYQAKELSESSPAEHKALIEALRYLEAKSNSD
jgi:hypothetical protein